MSCGKTGNLSCNRNFSGLQFWWLLRPRDAPLLYVECMCDLDALRRGQRMPRKGLILLRVP